MVASYGADATRMYALFAAPPDRDLDCRKTAWPASAASWAASGGW